MRSPVRVRPGRADRTGYPSEERLQRAVAVGFVPAALVFGGLVLPVVAAQWHVLPPAWTVTALAALLVPTLAAGALAPRGPIALVRRSALVALVAGLAVPATLLLVVQPGGTSGAPWPYDLAPMGVIVGVVAVRPRIAVSAAVVEAALLAAGRAIASGGTELVPALQDGIYALLFQVVFVSLGVATLAAGRSADEAAAQAQEAAAQTAAETARERELARVNALVHDRVLATLLSAADRTPGTRDLTRADAARALHDLRALMAPEGRREPIDAQELVWTLQGVTTELAPEARFDYEVRPGAAAVPPETVDAVVAATEEALRNSLRHSEAVNRAVHVAADAHGLRVEVLDDGVGFQPEQVPATRLGIAESILGRLRALPGGEAFVVSTPGVGTRVQLQVGGTGS